MAKKSVIIKKHREYHARAIKEPNFKDKVTGYNFSYPVLNTVEIGGLFISGGSREIQIERMGKSTWSFDVEKSTLTIEKDKKGKEIHYIDNPEELYSTMSRYWKRNAPALEEKNNNTAEKKSVANLGNQNARKDKDVYIDMRPKEFCDYGRWTGESLNEYFQWVRDNGWWDKLSDDDRDYAEKKGF